MSYRWNVSDAGLHVCPCRCAAQQLSTGRRSQPDLPQTSWEHWSLWETARCRRANTQIPRTGNYSKKFELMLTIRAKAYSSSCLQTVSLSQAISSQFILGVCAAAKDRKKSIKTPCFRSLESLEVIDVDTTEKLVTSASCDTQHEQAYLQPFSRKTGQQWYVHT